MADSGTLFTRSKVEKIIVDEDCDIKDNPWDDTLLIRAYDQAVNLAKANLENSKNFKDVVKSSTKMDCSTNKTSSEDVKSTDCWKVGAKCRATWSHDDIEYEAEIISLKSNRNQARIRFIGYNNEENVKINSLKPSHGEKARKKQIIESQNENEEGIYFSSTSPQYQHAAQVSNGEEGMMFPPPPPPHVISYLPKDEQEALSAMLMSWYMSGYHTGYYQGLISASKNYTNKKK